jgi:hypothetical protein
MQASLLLFGFAFLSYVGLCLLIDQVNSKGKSVKVSGK